MLALREPVAQLRFVLGQVDTGNADLLEAEFATPVLDLLGEGGVVYTS